jgi:hypothetical protein
VTLFPGTSAADGLSIPLRHDSRKLCSEAVQVFLSYAVADLNLELTVDHAEPLPIGHIVSAIYQLLVDAGFTLWDCQQIPLADFPEDIAVSRAIEASDNLVVLLSPRAIRHTLCLQGLLFALSMNKRIVPLLLEPIEQNQLPNPLQQLSMIDLQSITFPLAQSQVGKQLIQALTHEAAYHQAHKHLLLQALKWERQHRNSCLLIRGECLKQYLAWLKTAQDHSKYRPIRLQTVFLEVCLSVGQPSPWQVHLIHSPEDSAYARPLSELLQLFSLCTSFHHLELLMEGHPRQHRRRAIEQSHHCGVVVSPGAFQQEAFLDDLDYALSLHKPLFMVEMTATQVVTLPLKLRHYPHFHWPDLETASAKSFGQLFRLLAQHRPAAAYHAQLLQQALAWERQHHHPNLLLQHDQLNEAVTWLHSQPTPTPTDLQCSYIEASRHRRHW